MSTAWRWVGVLSTIVLVVAIAIGVSIAVVVSALPLDQATLVIDGERVELPAANGWQAVLALTLALLAVVLAALIAIAIAIAAAAFGVVVAAVVAIVTLLFAASPVLFIAWLIWLLVRRPSKPAPAGVVASA